MKTKFEEKALKFWSKRKALNYLISPLSCFWIFGSYLKKLSSTTYKSKSITTICIGNLNVGGSGKTPTAIALAKELSKKGKVCFITKGYKGSDYGPTIVLQTSDYKAVGDEPILLAREAPTIMCKNRISAIKEAEKQGFKFAIFDDGYQSNQVYYDYRILVVNGKFKFGNKMILPSGPLRESLNKGINKANSVILLDPSQRAENEIKKVCAPKKVYVGRYETKCKPSNSKKYIAFCGIAMPDKFLKTLKHYNFSVAHFKKFPDHHQYTNSQIDDIIMLAKKESCKIITTSKDFIKLSNNYREHIQELSIVNNIENIEEIANEITSI